MSCLFLMMLIEISNSMKNKSTMLWSDSLGKMKTNLDMWRETFSDTIEIITKKLLMINSPISVYNNISERWLFKDFIENISTREVLKELWAYRNSEKLWTMLWLTSTCKPHLPLSIFFSQKSILIMTDGLPMLFISCSWNTTLALPL